MTSKYFLLSLLMLCLLCSCDQEKRKDKILQEAEKDILYRDSLEALIKSRVLQEEFKDSTITNKIAEEENLSILQENLELTGYDDTLKSKNDFTVFAPTDKAFIEAPRPLDEESKVLTAKRLSQIVRYHIVGDDWTSKDIQEEIERNDGYLSMQTLSGKELEASLVGDAILLKDLQGKKATVIETDIDASNGTVHIIDAVLSAQ